MDLSIIEYKNRNYILLNRINSKILTESKFLGQDFVFN